MASVEEVREQLSRLNALVADAHPGLFSWKMSFGRALDDFCEYEKERERIRELEDTIERFRTYHRARKQLADWWETDWSAPDVPGRGNYVQLAERVRDAESAITDEDMG